jgi:hypothetical protein
VRNEPLRRPVAAAGLVAHHLPLAEELVLRDRPAAVPHARGLDLHQRVELIRARVDHEVRRVPVGVSVRAERRLLQDLPQRRSARAAGLLLEHDVLDQVRQARLARRIVARPDLVADVDLDELGRRIRHDDEAEAVLRKLTADLAVGEHELGP